MRPGWIMTGIFLMAAAVLVGAPFVGMERIPCTALWGQADDAGLVDILWQIRVPRVLTAFFAGLALAGSGVAYQAVFRNPLAEPFTLGVASGASVGAAAAIHFGLQAAAWGLSAVTICSFVGAVAVIGFVYGLARLRRGFSAATMLLAGVAVSFFCSSLILLLQYMSDFTSTFRMLRWVMGGTENVVDYQELVVLFPAVAVGGATLFYLTHDLNLLSTGEELAASRGVEVDRVKLAVFFVTSLMVAGVVALCGPIGFVGLMAPHICRLLVGSDHRRLLPAAAVFGGCFLVLCDAVARTVFAPTELPVGIVTSLLGGPFFLWLLLGRGAQRAGL